MHRSERYPIDWDSTPISVVNMVIHPWRGKLWGEAVILWHYYSRNVAFLIQLCALTFPVNMKCTFEDSLKWCLGRADIARCIEKTISTLVKQSRTIGHKYET